MTVSIHQPNFIPWIGYFYKISKSDTFVLLDNVQYTKNSFINRNRIKTPQGVNWLTIPVKQSGKSKQYIFETEIVNPEKSLSKIIKSVEQNYKKSKYFDVYFDPFCDILGRHPSLLSELNKELIIWVAQEFNMGGKIMLASEIIEEFDDATERLIAACKSLGADAYYSGFGGGDYQDEQLFHKNGIKLVYSSFNHPTYNQLWGDFEKNLSIIDLIFNEGAEGKKFLTNSDN
ncbi:MAG TPA: WbqC family protein [Cyclobacteriaceae bacterium]